MDCSGEPWVVVVASLSIMINIVACIVCIRHCRSEYDDATGEFFITDNSLISVDLSPANDTDEYAVWQRGESSV